MPDTNTDAAIERVRDAEATLSSGKQEDNEESADKAMGHDANPSDLEKPDRPAADGPAENELGKD
jgi:hypothetical protein